MNRRIPYVHSEYQQRTSYSERRATRAIQYQTGIRESE